MSDPQAMLRMLYMAVMNNDSVSRKNAEKTLGENEGTQGFTLQVLNLVANASKSSLPEDISVRQVAAAHFKNVIKKRWSPKEDDDYTPIPDCDRDIIKTNLVDLMCSTPKHVQRHLGEAVSIIAAKDFPDNWQNLLPQLVSKLQSQELSIVNGVMTTASSLFKKFRYAMNTDLLFRELKICLECFQEPLLQTIKQLSSVVFSNTVNDKEQLQQLMETIYQITRIFFSLNCQDLPEYFEDNMNAWMDEYAKYLSYSHALLIDANEEDEAGPIERVQSSIIECLNLYASKYEEEFSPHLPRFTQLIWKLLVDVNQQPKYDVLATNAIKFLTAVCSKQMYSNLFTDQVLKDIVENIVVKNLKITEKDEELFEDNPMDYTRKDMEGSDQETRRRCALELVRALLKLFGPQTSQLCVTYIQELMKQYAATNDWKLKDTALHIMLAVCIISSSAAQGAGELNTNINIVELFNTLVLPELSDIQTLNARPVVKADVIKLVCLFRSHLQTQQLSNEILPMLVQYLRSEHIVIHTYSALCIEKILVLKHKETVVEGAVSKEKMLPNLTKQHLNPHIHPLFTNLFQIIEHGGGEAENEYVMKCTMRVLLVIGTDLISALELVSNKLTGILARVCKNPINPYFNHYLFECIAVMITIACEECAEVNKELVATNCTKFEQLLFPSFQVVLTEDVTEFIPYVFQILSQLLFYRPTQGLSDAYKALFPPLMSPVLWESKGNVVALMELFQSYIIKGVADIVAGGHLVGVLGIFQKLLSAKSTEQHAFTLLNMIFRYSTYASIESYLPTIFQLVLNRMMSVKSVKLYRLVVHMLCVFTINFNAKPLYMILESIQANLFTMIMQQVYTPTLCNSLDILSGCEVAVGTAKLLGAVVGNNDDVIPVLQQNANNIWTGLAKNMVCTLVSCSTLATGSSAVSTSGLLTNILNSSDEGSIMGGMGNSQEFDNVYSKLVHATVPRPTQVIINGNMMGNTSSSIFENTIGMCANTLQTVVTQGPQFKNALTGVVTDADQAKVLQMIVR